ncbi:NUDIX hydrolase [Glycomyces sp. MUSA5-2]|uniref:NUDIX hydrolase n=1 Tax=Glycomyces sp. MUSA5-2 TaxID=2053002 RepID=UPI00300855B9
MNTTTHPTDDRGRALIRYTGDLVVFAEDYETYVLVIERGTEPFKGRLALPGGHVEHGETSLEAAVRETAEETGLAVDAAALHRVDVFDAVDRDPRGRVVSVAYTLALRGLPHIRGGSDAVNAKWIDVETALRQGRMAFDHRDILAAAHDMYLDGHLD